MVMVLAPKKKAVPVKAKKPSAPKAPKAPKVAKEEKDATEATQAKDPVAEAKPAAAE